MIRLSIKYYFNIKSDLKDNLFYEIGVNLQNRNYEIETFI